MLKKKHHSDSPKVYKPKSWQSDIIGIFIFVAIVAVGVFVINQVVFRSYSVTGGSMEPTFYTNDRIIVNRLPVTWAKLQGKEYVPERGQIIVFENPRYQANTEDRYIVKRVIAYPEERVVVKDCNIRVYNDEHPSGFDPYDDFNIKPDCVSGSLDQVTPAGEIFVVGDHRDGHHSLDSRSGLGTISYNLIVGPVGLQIYPFNKIQIY